MSSFRPINRDSGFLLPPSVDGCLRLRLRQLARTMGMLKLATVAPDGTKVHANASRHSALSWGHAKKIEKQLMREVQQLLRLVVAAEVTQAGNDKEQLLPIGQKSWAWVRS